MEPIEKTVSIDLDELLPREDWDYDRILDLFSEKVTGSTVGLVDIQWRVIGVNSDGTLRLRVSGLPNDED